MFLHLSVSHSVQGRVVSAAGGAWSWGVSAPGGCLVLGGVRSRGISGRRGPAPGGSLVPGGLLHGVPGGDPPPNGYCYGQYASYWNAFLLNINFSLMHITGKTYICCFGLCIHTIVSLY